MTVQRYTMDMSLEEELEDPEGDWVRYEDVRPLLEAALGWLEEADAQQYEPGPEYPAERALYLAAQGLRASLARNSGQAPEK